MCNLVRPAELHPVLHECIVYEGAIAAVASDREDSLGFQVRPAYTPSFREQMVLSTREDKGVIDQLRELDIGVRCTDEVDAEICLAARHRLQAFVRANIENPNVNSGICIAESRHSERQEIEHRRRDGSNRDEPGAPRAEIAYSGSAGAWPEQPCETSRCR